MAAASFQVRFLFTLVIILCLVAASCSQGYQGSPYSLTISQQLPSSYPQPNNGGYSRSNNGYSTSNYGRGSPQSNNGGYSRSNNGYPPSNYGRGSPQSNNGGYSRSNYGGSRGGRPGRRNNGK